MVSAGTRPPVTSMAASTIDRVKDFTPYPNSTMLRRSTESRV